MQDFRANSDLHAQFLITLIFQERVLGAAVRHHLGPGHSIRRAWVGVLALLLLPAIAHPMRQQDSRGSSSWIPTTHVEDLF